MRTAVLEAELSGASEVDADGAAGVGDPDGSGHAYVFGIDDDPTTLCYVITATGIDPTFEAGEVGAAHIHRGAEGERRPWSLRSPSRSRATPPTASPRARRASSR